MNIYRQIPKKDKILSYFDTSYSKTILNYIIDNVLENLRTAIKKGSITEIDSKILIDNIKKEYHNIAQGTLKNVINATGVVLHTNLGRAPLSEKIIDSVKKTACRYSNLEFDLNTGKRGERYHHAVEYLKILTNCEDAIVVNNNAAAVFLINNTFNKEKEVIISRSELVEIGGSFRIPEVIKNSGAILKEVGTTNKTKESDYINSISENSNMIMKVHKSNYAIVGFFEEVPYDKIPKIAKKYNLLSYCDLGSGSFLQNIGCDEPTVQQIHSYGYDLVSFSGDKLLGSVQCGIIIGKKKLIDKLKTNHLLRMLRVDKLTLAILQETLLKYIRNPNEILSLNLLSQEKAYLKKKASKLKKILQNELKDYFEFTIENISSYTGGGSCPHTEIQSVALICKPVKNSPDHIAKKLREYQTPIITRISDDKLIFDVRTIFDDELKVIKDALLWAINQLS